MALPTTIDDAYNAVNPDLPLQSGDPHYVDLGEVRGGRDLAKRLAQSLRRSDLGEGRRYRRQLLTGHRRCGKTTELFRLQHELETHRYFVVYIDAEAELDLADISYLDVLLTIAKQIEQQLSEAKIHLKAELLENIKDWFAEHIITRIESRDNERVLKAEYGLGLESPALIIAKMLATLTAHIRASVQRRDEIRKVLEHELSAFTDLLNLLVDDAQKRLADKNHAGLVVIVDGLERMLFRVFEDGRSSHEDFFITHAEQLCSPRCHLFLTVPISLLYNRNVQQNFDDCDVIPMVSIYRRGNRSTYEPGREKLREVVARRLDVDAVFAGPKQLDQLIEMSGGHVGELLRLIRYAFDYSDDRVQQEAVDRAVQKLVNDYDRLTKDSDLPILHRVHDKRDASGDPDTARLLLDLLILEYDGDRWADVHPAVQATRKFKESAPKLKKRAAKKKK